MAFTNDAGETIFCPECGSDNMIRAGVFRSKQRYRCKECGKYFTPKATTKTLPQLTEQKAAQLLYMAGLHNEEIQKLFGVSYPKVTNWIWQLQDIVAADEGMQKIRRPKDLTIETIPAGVNLKPTKGKTGIFIELDEGALGEKIIAIKMDSKKIDKK